MSQYYTIVTDAGTIKIANAITTSTLVNITQIAVGDGNGSEYAPTGQESALRRETWRGSVAAVTPDANNPNWIKIEGSIPANIGGFTLREVGLFDDSGTLIAIGNYPSTYKPTANDGSTLDLVLNTIINVQNADVVTTTVDPNVVVASKQYVQQELEKIAVIVEDRIPPEVYDNPRIQRAIDKAFAAGGGEVLLDRKKYSINPGVSLTLPTNVSLVGSGMRSTILESISRRTVRMIQVTGNNTSVEKLTLDLHEYSENSNLTPVPHVEIDGGINTFSAEKCEFLNGYAGIWLNPLNRGEINDVSVHLCVFKKLRHSVYIGIDRLELNNRTDLISDVTITNNTIKDGLYESDGIKTTQRCRNLIIANNVISNQTRDAIDLFASGENVIISNNILKGNLACGLDIKRNTTGYPAILGESRNMIIENNIIENNTTGVMIAQIDGSPDDVYLVDISNNTFVGNHENALRACGDNINITSNLFSGNCTKTNANYGAIRIEGKDASRYVRYINVTANQIVNNGAVGVDACGIRMIGYAEDVNIIGNSITNNPKLPNDNQRIGVYITSENSGITLRDNKIKGHHRDVWVRTGADVRGESRIIDLADESITGSLKNISALLSGSRKTITSVRVINGNNIAASTTNYLQVRLRKRIDGVLNAPNLGSRNTQASGLSAYSPLVVSPTDSDINSYNGLMLPNETFVVTFQVEGTLVMSDAHIEVNYITH